MSRGHHAQVRDLLIETFGDRDIIGIEIGTAMGCLPKALFLQMPNVKYIYTIDPYLHDPTSAFEAHFPVEQQEARRAHARQALEPYKEKCTLIEDTSDNAVVLTPDSVDFVWIDGDHSRDQIKKDILNYYGKVKVGGIFGGHDYQHAIPVFRDMIEGTIHLGDDWTWWIIKDDRILK